jgi:hypothetical protein
MQCIIQRVLNETSAMEIHARYFMLQIAQRREEEGDEERRKKSQKRVRNERRFENELDD